ncbi:nucleotidyltransferase domain-containing protein [Agromyces sp. NPDC057679]|uniref:nucleotidyltransferase domain-containing protein n=1 Tax=Agromyces sp. NPDC057679 TaxID=3346207 RepID=UPI003671C2F9
MDLSSPLATLTSPVEAGILKVLARADTEFSGRQVHRLSGVGSAPGVWKALQRLSESGLVHARQRPSETLYSLNREHLLFPAIEAALAAEQTLFDRMRTFTEEHAPEGTSVSVFGSVSRREAGPGSDVDLVVTFPDDVDEDTASQFRDDLAVAIERWTGNAASIIALPETDAKTQLGSHEPIFVSMKRDAVYLVGPMDIARLA